MNKTKYLPEGNGEGAWDNSLVNDLDHIKKSLRYPMRLKTLKPVLIWALFLMLVTSIVASAYLAGDSRKMPYFLFLLNMISATAMAVRYIQTLRFQQVRTGLFVQQNSAILESFLKAQQLLVFRHPEIPEVYQILSRNLYRAGNSEKREVIIFIADDKRILVNSHFTETGFVTPPGGRHHKQMAEKLKEWIKKHEAVDAGLVHQTF